MKSLKELLARKELLEKRQEETKKEITEIANKLKSVTEEEATTKVTVDALALDITAYYKSLCKIRGIKPKKLHIERLEDFVQDFPWEDVVNYIMEEDAVTCCQIEINKS